MKKIISFVLLTVLLFSLTACNGVKEVTDVEANKPSNSNDYTTIEGVYVDSSAVVEEGSPLKRVYVFLTVNATDKNLKVYCNNSEMTIGDTNKYKSTFVSEYCDFMPNYYYKQYVEDVYIGSQKKVALVFNVPEGDLTPGKKITFSNFDIPFENIEISTDDIVSCANVEEIAKKVDESGYNEIAKKREPADEATVNLVKSKINGYYFEFYITVGTQVMKYELEFFEPNKFELRTQLGANSGTYDVRNNYIFCTYSSNGNTVEVPYEINETGEIALDCTKAFSIYE